MTYKQDFVAVIKHSGKILRETEDSVLLPFGSEYSILMKNLNSRKAVVKISIDGKDVLDGNGLVINPNCDIELLGFMKGQSVTNRFKFIKKTEKIVQHRGDRIDDGVVRVEFRFEKKRVTEIKEVIEHRTTCYHCGCYPCYCRPCTPFHPWKITWYNRQPFTLYDLNNSMIGSSLDNNSTTYNCSDSSDMRKMSGSVNTSMPEIKKDEGITVKGSEAFQNFMKTYTGELEEHSSVINIILRGTDSKNVKIEKPVTVRNRIPCENCGTKNKSNVKYCRECGTYLL